MTTNHEPHWAKNERHDLTPELLRHVNWRWMGECVVCDTTDDPHIGYIVPIALGGKSTEENLWIICAKHNNQKGDQWPIYWAQKLLDDLALSRQPGHHHEPEATSILWDSTVRPGYPAICEIIDDAIRSCIRGDVPPYADWNDN